MAEPAEPIKPLDYPPASHILRALGIESIMRSDFTSSAWLPVTPFVGAPWGGVRAGVLATLVDVAGGGLAVPGRDTDLSAGPVGELTAVLRVDNPAVEVRAARKALKYVNEKRLVDIALEYVAANPALFPETAVALAEPKSS